MARVRQRGVCGELSAAVNSGYTAAANIAWPEMPVKSSAAMPMPQPRKASLVAVVIAAAPASSPSHHCTSGRVATRRASHHENSSAAGSRICASPSRVTKNQNGEVVAAAGHIAPMLLPRGDAESPLALLEQHQLVVACQVARGRLDVDLVAHARHL